MNRLVNSVDPLLGRTYNSLGLSRSQDDVEFFRRMETTEA